MSALSAARRGENPACSTSTFSRARQVGLVDEAAAGLAGDAVGGAGRAAAGPRHHAHAVVGLVVAADRLAPLALDTDRIVGDHRLLAVQQVRDDLQDLVLVDRAAVGGVVDLDGGRDRLRLLRVEVRLRGCVAVDELPCSRVWWFLSALMPARRRALAVGDDDGGALADALEAGAVGLAREAALDEGDVDRLGRLLGHGLAELDNVDVLEELEERRVAVVGELDLAALAAGEIEERDLRLAHQNASSRPWTSANGNTGPSTHTYLSLIWQWPHLPTPHFMRRSRSTKTCSRGMPIMSSSRITKR